MGHSVGISNSSSSIGSSSRPVSVFNRCQSVLYELDLFIYFRLLQQYVGGGCCDVLNALPVGPAAAAKSASSPASAVVASRQPASNGNIDEIGNQNWPPASVSLLCLLLLSTWEMKARSTSISLLLLPLHSSSSSSNFIVTLRNSNKNTTTTTTV